MIVPLSFLMLDQKPACAYFIADSPDFFKDNNFFLPA